MNRLISLVLAFFCCFTFEVKSQAINSSLKRIVSLETDQSFLVQNPSANSINEHKFKRLILKLERKRAHQKNDIAFLKTVFYKTHQKILLEYNKLANLNETLVNGSYGCLSGTMTYALILEHFNFNFDILELPNHVFIQVKAKDQVIYFESTLPNEGFITHQKEVSSVDDNSEDFNSLAVVATDKASPWNLNRPIRKISWQQLNALQHFNESIKQFNKNQFNSSIKHAVEAYALYPSDRNLMLMQLILNKARNFKGASEKIRQSYLQVFKEQLAKKGIAKQLSL